MWCKIRVQFHSFAYDYSVFSTLFIEETALSLLCVLGILVKDHLTIYAWIYLWALYSVSLVSLFVFMQVPYSFDYCSFVTCFEVSKCKAHTEKTEVLSEDLLQVRLSLACSS